MMNKILVNMIPILILTCLGFGCSNEETSSLDYISVVLPDESTEGAFNVYGYIYEEGSTDKTFILTVGPAVKRRGPEHERGIYHLVRDCSDREIYENVDHIVQVAHPKQADFDDQPYFRFDKGMDLSCQPDKGGSHIGDIYINYDEDWNESYYIATGRQTKDADGQVVKNTNEFYTIPYGSCFPKFLENFMNIQEKQKDIKNDSIPTGSDEVILDCVKNKVSETDHHRAYRTSENTIVIESKDGSLPLVINRVDNELISDNYMGYLELKKDLEKNFGLNYFAPSRRLSLPELYLRYDYCTNPNLNECSTRQITSNLNSDATIGTVVSFDSPDGKDLRTWTAFEGSDDNLKQVFNDCSPTFLNRLGLGNATNNSKSDHWLDKKISGFNQWKSRDQSEGYFNCHIENADPSQVCVRKIYDGSLSHEDFAKFFESCEDLQGEPDPSKNILKIVLKYDLTVKNPDTQTIDLSDKKWKKIEITSDKERRTLRSEVSCSAGECYVEGFSFKLGEPSAEAEQLTLTFNGLDIEMVEKDAKDLGKVPGYIISVTGSTSPSLVEFRDTVVGSKVSMTSSGLYIDRTDLNCIDCQILGVMEGIYLISGNASLVSDGSRSLIEAENQAITTDKSAGNIFMGDMNLVSPSMIKQLGAPDQASMRVGILDSVLHIQSQGESSQLHFGFQGFSEHFAGTKPVESLSIRGTQIKVPSFTSKALSQFNLVGSDCKGANCRRGALIKIDQTNFWELDDSSGETVESVIDASETPSYVKCEEGAKAAIFWPEMLNRPIICRGI